MRSFEKILDDCFKGLEKSEKFFIDNFLDYFNNYLTVAKFAEDRGITIEKANQIIRIGNHMHEKKINDLKRGKK